MAQKVEGFLNQFIYPINTVQLYDVRPGMMPGM
jgi:hypothetical protein